jgi:hypothetical protein
VLGIGPAIGEVISTIAAQGVAITGPWLTYHRKMVNQEARKPGRGMRELRTLGSIQSFSWLPGFLMN